MKKIFLVCLLLIAGPAIALTQQVPALFNYQGVLLDEGGNPLPDGISNLKFQISDSAGNVLYEEAQDVDVAKGQISAIVGNGLNPSNGAPTGGIPSDVFDPTDTHYLQVEVAGQSPYDRLEIVATPYSLWADTALRLPDGAITSAMIGKGMIKKEHLDEELMNAIFPDGIPKGMLPKDTVYNEEFTSFRDTVQSISGAGKVGVTNAFIYSGSQTVQGVLSDFDLAIKKRQEEVEFTKRNVDVIDAKNLDKAGDTMTGNLVMQSSGTAAEAAGDIILNGISEDKSIKTASIDSQTGNITTIGNVILDTVGATIDGIDITSFKSNYDDHVASSAAHGVSETIVGTTDSQTLSNKTLSSPTINEELTISGNINMTNHAQCNKSLKLCTYVAAQHDPTPNDAACGTLNDGDVCSDTQNRVDGVDISNHHHGKNSDGGSLYPYAIQLFEGSIASDGAYFTPPSGYICKFLTSFASGPSWHEDINGICLKNCYELAKSSYNLRCRMTNNGDYQADSCSSFFEGSSCSLSSWGTTETEPCKLSMLAVCVRS